MIKINLLREKKSGGARKAAAGGMATPAGEGFQPIHLAVILILLAAMSFVGLKWYSLDQELTRRENEKRSLEREKQELQPIIKKKEELEKKRDLLDRKIKIITDLRKRQQGPVRLLDEISKNLPDYVWLTSLTEQDFNVSIEGNALNPAKLSDFVDNLNHSGFFPEVDLLGYNVVKAGDTEIKFRLSCKFKLPEAPADTAGGAHR